MQFELFGLSSAYSVTPCSLLCSRLATPATPDLHPASPARPIVWIHDKQSLTSTAVPESPIACLNSDRQARHDSPQEKSEQLFREAHRLLAAGDQIAADRCIQQALRTRAAGTSDIHSLQEQDVRNSVSWIVLATASLLKQDLDSCETWLRQAERALHVRNTDVDSPEFLTSAGNLFAVKACLLVQANGRLKANALLIHACDCHVRAEAWLAAAQDLILRSRLLSLDRRWSEADALLNQAESRLQHHLNVYCTDRIRIVEAISHDRSALRRCLQFQTAALSN